MSDFGACKSCGRVYSLARLKACPRCGDVDTSAIQEVRIPTTVKRDLSYTKPVPASESDAASEINRVLPSTTSCRNCGRDFRSDKLKKCPRCGYQEQITPPIQVANSSQLKSGQETKCAFCNNLFSQTFDFCPNCGSKVKISTGQQIVEEFVMPLKLETNLVKSQAQLMPLSERRQAKNNKEKNLVVSIISILVLLIIAIFFFKSLSLGNSNNNQSSNNESNNNQSISYEFMYNAGQNFAKVSGPGVSAVSQCSMALSKGAIERFGRPFPLGIQSTEIQGHLRTEEGFQGCLDGFNSF